MTSTAAQLSLYELALVFNIDNDLAWNSIFTAAMNDRAELKAAVKAKVLALVRAQPVVPLGVCDAVHHWCRRCHLSSDRRNLTCVRLCDCVWRPAEVDAAQQCVDVWTAKNELRCAPKASSQLFDGCFEAGRRVLMCAIVGCAVRSGHRSSGAGCSS